jgi:hypothetical protein
MSEPALPTEQKRLEILAKQRTSGLPVAAFCRRNGPGVRRGEARTYQRIRFF